MALSLVSATGPSAMAVSSPSSSLDDPLVMCNPQVAPLKRKPAAKRKYNLADSLDDVQIQEHLCIKGCRLKQFLALPITSVDGVRYTRIASKESWMCELLAGRVCTSEMHAGVSKLKEFVIRELSGSAPADSQLQAKMHATTSMASLGAAVVELDSEDDEEPAAQPERRRREMGRRHMGTMKGAINLRGLKVVVMLQHRTLWVEATATAVAAMLNQLQRCLVPDTVKAARQTQAVLGRQPDSPASTSGSSSCAAETPADSQTTADKPKVYMGNGRYYVSFVNEHGRRSTCSKGLAIRQRDEHGNPLSATAYAAELDRIRELAVQRWRDLDRGSKSLAASQT